MAKRYSRLELKLPSALKMSDFSFKFIIKNSSTDKVVYVDEGKFDVGGFTKWFEIMQTNRTLYYEIYQKNCQTNKNIKVQTVLAKAYEKPNNWSLYAYKVSSGTTKKEKENIKEIYLNNGEVAWYLIKNKETATSWARKVYKYQLTAKDWDILKQNNPHIPQFDSKATLTPGQVVILSNSTTAKELPEYKKLARDAHKNLEKMVYGQGVDAQFFAQNYEFFYDALNGSGTQLIKRNDFSYNSDPLTIKFNSVEEKESFFEQRMAADASLAFSEGRVAKVYKKHAELVRNYSKANIKGSPNASVKFSQFRKDNARLINELKQADAQKFLKWDQNIKTNNLRKMLNQSVPAKGKSYKGGMQAYVKNMMEVGKVARYLKGAGYLGIAVDVIDGGIKIYNAVPEEKTRTTVVEGTKIATGVGMGVLTTYLVIGVATGGAGLLVLGLVVGAGVLTSKAVSDVSGSIAGSAFDAVQDRLDK